MDTRDSEKLRNLLLKIDFLPHIDDGRFQKLTDHFIKKTFHKGDVIIAKDEHDDSFYIIAKGAAQVLVEDENDEIREARSETEGNYFGEIALITGGIRTAWVVASGDVEVFVLAKSDVETYLMTIPALAKKILDTAHNRLMS
jgi:CRP-like cAMP-binding protein